MSAKDLQLTNKGYLISSHLNHISFLHFKCENGHHCYINERKLPTQLGGPVNFTCVLPKTETGRRDIHWYHQRAGDTLKIIWTLKESATPKFAPAFDNSRWEANYDKNVSNLTILKTNQDDEGIYHCGFTEWLQDTTWSGTYLLVLYCHISNYTVVQEKTVHAGNSVTLHCSLFSDAENKTCPGGHHVFWFREASHPDIIYTEGNRHHECEKRSEAQRSCVFRSSKNVSSSNAATYYCAVATCGLILFGNGTKQEMESLLRCFLFFAVQTAGSAFIALVIAIICLVISLILNVIFICCRTPGAACELNYAALQFSGRKTTRGKKKKDELETEESVYSQVKCRM
uniref:Ig-like domain-containing protein n=1 Tax=Maylandia zebra TaxID=106582 RepID=A0A3P9ARX1_9CICH